ncbi:MAG: ribonuclease domain-containing protein [Flavitalea sp.]
MLKNYSRLIIGLTIGLVMGYFIANHHSHTAPSGSLPSTTVTQNSLSGTTDNAIPEKVFEVLKYIRSNHHSMEGYVGGRVFSNREKIVPHQDNNGNSIHYQEWDVNVRVPGQNRGTERLLTGSDGRAWYTNDHYQSFREIK